MTPCDGVGVGCQSLTCFVRSVTVTVTFLLTACHLAALSHTSTCVGRQESAPKVRDWVMLWGFVDQPRHAHMLSKWLLHLHLHLHLQCFTGHSATARQPLAASLGKVL